MKYIIQTDNSASLPTADYDRVVFDTTQNTVIIKEKTTTPPIPNDEIWYTSTDGGVINVNNPSYGVTIISNTYENGKGVIKLSADLDRISADFLNYDSEISQKIKTITLPASLTEIAGYGFYQCWNLNEITCYATTAPEIETYSFEECSAGGTIYYPKGSAESYANDWLSTYEYYPGYYGWTGKEM